MKILLADDSRFFRAIESKFLQKTPVEVLESDNGSEVLSIIRNERPDMVYMYFGLPGINGEECCRQIKADRSLQEIPVVMICDNNAPEQVSAAKSAGCDAFLVKPLDRLSFLQVGREFLEVIREYRQPSFFMLKFSCGGEVFNGKCLDISGGGMFIETPEEISVGELLNLELILPDTSDTEIKCTGEVMWLNQKPNAMKPHYPNGLGVRFVEMSPETRKAITGIAGK